MSRLSRLRLAYSYLGVTKGFYLGVTKGLGTWFFLKEYGL
jgi:hypothetical protein